MKKIIPILLLAAVLVISLAACVKKDFDEPPFGADYDPNLPVNMTIADLKDLYQLGFNSSPYTVSDETIISGVITANDQSGNFYKQIIIQDETGAIGINIDKTGLHNEYPVGRKIYLKCKGLTISDYGSFKQIGYGQDADGIPSNVKDDYVIKATFPVTVEPKLVSLGDVNSVFGNEDLVGMLIKFERAEFSSADLGKTFAEPPSAGSGTNRTLQSCDEATMIMRTSNYAAFQAVELPTGSGSLTAIYSRFNNDAQLLIRDLNDVQFDQGPCPFGTASDSLISIQALRNSFVGGTQPISNRKIRGVVISDPNEIDGDNITGKNMVMQDGEYGIVLRFSDAAENQSQVGDSIEVIISGHNLSEFGNLLQVGDQLVAGDVLKLGTGTITPKVLTINDILTDFEKYESTLVTIQNATLIGNTQNPGKYDGSIDINDGSTTSNFILHTQYYAKFADDVAPIGQSKNITGFLWSTSTAQRIAMRTTNDIN